MPQVDIYIRTHQPDFKWLQYCLASITRRCRGFNALHIEMPDRDRPAFENDFSVLLTDGPHEYKPDFPVHVHTCPCYLDDYLGQQISKMRAWMRCAAPLILYVDSDVIFLQDVTPDDWLGHDGLPVLWTTRFDSLRGPVLAWQSITEAALGVPCQWETMRRLPMIHHADVVMNAYGAIGGEAYIVAQPFHCFSEFNVIGSWALRNAADRYDVRDTDAVTPPPNPCRQFWSHTPWTDELREELGRLING